MVATPQGLMAALVHSVGCLADIGLLGYWAIGRMGVRVRPL
jgi:hypothetical protein